MFKPRVSNDAKVLILELLHLMSTVDGTVTTEETKMIKQVKKLYKMKRYEFQNLSQEDIRIRLTELPEEDVRNVLTHAMLLALSDGEFSHKERDLVLSYYDLLSIQSAGMMQDIIDEHGNESYDVRDFYNTEASEEEVFEESLEIFNDFQSDSVEDIDEGLLMKMKKGPVKKVWDQVMKLWEVVQDPKTDKALKVLGIGALLYLISPIDAIPDMIPILGLTDDVGIIAYVMTQLMKSTKHTK